MSSASSHRDLSLKIPLLSLPAFKWRLERKRTKTPFSWGCFPWCVLFVHLQLHSCFSFTFTFYPPIFLSLSLFLFSLVSISSNCLSISPSYLVSLSIYRLRLSFVYMCSDTDKSRPCWNACAADLALIVRWPRWAFRATAFFSDQMIHRP